MPKHLYFSCSSNYHSVYTTQHYAKVLNRKVSEDMMVLKNKYKSIEPQKKKQVQ
ncbi:hypothetical protein SLW70_08050 [Flavobacterium sp. NG2]|uniref:hypothetical protein n=1 Tax=Flavobacterium sp. NG2 TaxID=3097547 RepID=UPI002A7F9236|nr:hypothetical protein [Flavobacterium sp. NG2]WPR73057.1 hypothetical protein SLW70_08050 [Flavobacterium sp. NG2]